MTTERPAPAAGRREQAVVVGLIGLAALAKLALAGRWSLLADEAYYAHWSDALAWGYYDQPPVIAALVAAGRLLGDTDVAVRLPAIACGAAGALAVLPLHRDRALGAVWWLAAPPLLWLTFFATPDAPLLAAWAGVVAAASRGGRWWWLAGALWAVASLSKYTGLLVFPLAWWATGDRDRDVAGGLLLGLALMLPHALWLFGHDAVSVRFQLGEGLLHHAPPGLLGPPQVALQQLGVLTPLLAVAAVWAWTQPATDRVARIAWWTSAPVAAAFFVAALGGPPEAHWLAPCWVGVGLLLDRARGRLARLTWSGVGLGLFASALLVAHAQLRLFPLPIDPADRVREGPLLAEAVGAWALPAGVGLREAGAGAATPVLTERYQEAALIRWYAGIDAFRHPGCGRADQHDLWGRELPARYLFVRPTTAGPLTCADHPVARHALVGQAPAGPVVGRWDLFEVVRDSRDRDPAAARPDAPR